MKVWTIIMVCLLIFLIPPRGTAEDMQGTELDVFLNDVEAKVQNKISEYDKDKQHTLLLDAQKLVDDAARLRVEGLSDREKRVQRVFKLRLLLLNKCFNERDYSYDFPSLPIKVSPPRWALNHQGNLIAGMRPEDVIDPEARRQYEEAIAENNRKRDKREREWKLQDIVEDQILLLTNYMINMRRKPEPQSQMWNSVETMVESQTLKDRLLKAFIEEIEGYNKLNEKYITEADIVSLEWLKSKETANTPVLDMTPPKPTLSTTPEPEGEPPLTIEEGENSPEPTTSTIPEPEGAPAATIEEGENEGEVTTVQEADKPAVTEQAPQEDGGNRILLAGILVGVLVVLLLVFAGYNRRKS